MRRVPPTRVMYRYSILNDNNNIVINTATGSIGIFGLSVKTPIAIHFIDLFMSRKRTYALNDDASSVWCTRRVGCGYLFRVSRVRATAVQYDNITITQNYVGKTSGYLTYYVIQSPPPSAIDQKKINK